MTERLDYRGAGVDIDVADSAMGRIKALVESTRTAGARGHFGEFGGMFRVPPSMARPVLVSSADGVGTKIKVAIDANRHDTIGQCLVNHCVNDILVQGALPLFFLDYVAFGALVPEVLEGVVRGVATACRENGCALLGGETAEMPGVYQPPDYDLAGFIVGAVEEDAILGPQRVRDGDVLIAFGSSGLHTNGFSLARKIVSERLRLAPGDAFPGEPDGRSTADTLLAVHRSYLPALRASLSKVHAMAHITGGGIPGNLVRALPAGHAARVNARSWTIPNLFQQLERAGNVERDEMFRAFNMGVGMIVICADSDADAIARGANDAGVAAWRIGDVVKGDGNVHIV